MGRLLDVGDTRLYVDERGPVDGPPVLVLHGGPGLDHTVFGNYLDPLADGYRLVLVDQRAQGRSDRDVDPHSWTLHQMARDVSAVAADLGTERYAVLGHSYGGFVALQHAVDAPGAAAATVVSNGLASSRWLAGLARELETFEPAELRAQVAGSWEREASVATEREAAALLSDQLPFHFRDPRDPRIEELRAGLRETRFAPDVLRHFASTSYGGIDVEDRLGEVCQPVLVLAGRYDRICGVAGAQAMAERLPAGELVVFDNSGHLPYVEEPRRYLEVVRRFLDRALGSGG
jgi:proline iminopeptidase